MAYRLKRGQPIDSEVRRIADKQLDLALAALRGVGSRKYDKATHTARRHIKKIRALIRLFQPSLGKSYRLANRRLRTVSRLLAPIADGEAVVDTLDRIGRKYRKDFPRRTFDTIRDGLMQLELRADRKATADHVLESAARFLRAEQTHARLWLMDESGFRAVASGLEKSMRRTRRAMMLALQDPTNEHYHVWRRRVKDLWLQVRLLQARCGGRLARDEAQLERLDGSLGEYHNCILLEEVLTAEALASRQHTARCLRLIRRYQQELRREIWPLAVELHVEKPRRFVRRVRRLWRSATPSGPSAARPVWQRAA